MIAGGSIAVGLISRSEIVLGQGLGLGQPTCTASSTVALIGDDISTQILASSSRRAWTRVQINNNATNTVFLAVNDVPAAINTGFVLGGNLGASASTTPYIDFGLNTPFPYTGAVKAITNISTTTVIVTQCVY